MARETPEAALYRRAEELRAARAARGETAPVLIALDGRCAAGKTTLARRLSERFGWRVLHMDDFFLRPEQRTPERYAQPGGNIDYERFLDEALRPLRAGTPAWIRRFDCGRMRLTEPALFEPSPVTLIEGTYACHPALWEGYDLRLFLTVGAAEQRRRIEAREGPAGAAVFRDRWIPLEERYFAAYSIESRCDFVWAPPHHSPRTS